MSAETGKSSTESEAVSGLDYEDTELTLGLGLGPPRSEPERKRAFETAVGLSLATRGGDLAAESSEGRAAGPSKPPAAKAQAVGWPPVRAFRKNVLKSCTYVKVAVDGAPYLRKVDLETYGGYEQLLAALEEMFSCFKIRNVSNERRLVDPVNGTEYVPTYEDKDGDWMLVGDVPWNGRCPLEDGEWMLVGDVPWKMFVASCKRLRLMKSSEAVNLAPRASQGNANNTQ